MPEVKNVGQADQIIRIILGLVCLVAVVYHFFVEAIMPIYALIPVIILVPYFLKTGWTRVCPIMKAMKVSTMKKEG